MLLRRVIPVTMVAVVLSAACAFAFSPKLSRIGRLVGGVFGIDRGFTPVPRTHADSLLLFATEGGAPGTYCPIPARGAQKAAGDLDARAGQDLVPAQTSTADVKGDSLLLVGGQTKCAVPAATPPAGGGRTIVP